jgi:hypothetical protein
MAIDDKKQELSSSKMPEMPKEKAPEPEPKKEPQDKSIWGGKQYIKGEDFRKWARSDEAWKRTNLSESDRMKIGKDLFAKEGNYFKTKDAEKALKGLNAKRAYANTDAERKEIDKEIKVVKGILGK